jgi:hypothetical protein
MAWGKTDEQKAADAKRKEKEAFAASPLAGLQRPATVAMPSSRSISRSARLAPTGSPRRSAVRRTV